MKLKWLIVATLATAQAGVQTDVDASTQTLGAYFANWAQYHKSPYTYKAPSLRPIINRLNQIYFGFGYFCPPAGTSPMPYWAHPPYGHCTDETEYQVINVEPNDAEQIRQIIEMKSNNPDLK